MQGWLLRQRLFWGRDLTFPASLARSASGAKWASALHRPAKPAHDSGSFSVSSKIGIFCCEGCGTAPLVNLPDISPNKEGDWQLHRQRFLIQPWRLANAMAISDQVGRQGGDVEHRLQYSLASHRAPRSLRAWWCARRFRAGVRQRIRRRRIFGRRFSPLQLGSRNAS